jgi:hypothetical protein
LRASYARSRSPELRSGSASAPVSQRNLAHAISHN